MTRIVLAYSGDLATTVAIPWLMERYGAEVVTLTLDLGQGSELTAVRERALAAGAVRAHVVDAREELVSGFMTPALQAGALLSTEYPISPELGLSLVGRRLVDVARMESASAVAHGGISDSVLGRSVAALAPSLRVFPFATESGLSAASQSDFAKARSIAAPPGEDAALSVDANVGGRVVRAPAIGEPSQEMIGDPFALTRAPADCPDEPAYLEVDFEAGMPVRANGIDMPMPELIESLDIIAGAHGVGRIEVAAGRSGAVRTVREAPAVCVLSTAHRQLETLVLQPDVLRLKRGFEMEYARLIHEGRWFSDAREALDAFVSRTQRAVSGTVRVRLVKGDCQAVARRAGEPDSRNFSSTSDPLAVGVPAEGRTP